MRTVFTVMAACAWMTMGCELADTAATPEESAPTPTPTAAPPAETPAPTTPDPISSDQAAWNSIEWYTERGPACTQAQQTMTISASISDDGRYIYFDYDPIPWGGQTMGHFFVWEGDHWSGGKFEWISGGGQKVKLTQNIVAGYNGLSAPPSGSRVAFAWTAEDCSQRSNLAETTWP